MIITMDKQEHLKEHVLIFIYVEKGIILFIIKMILQIYGQKIFQIVSLLVLEEK